jgi:single-stranded-DNA-specific exonuclease
MRALAFGRAEEWLADLQQNHEQPLDLAFRPVINEFRGYRTVELHLVDWRLHSAQTEMLQSVG